MKKNNRIMCVGLFGFAIITHDFYCASRNSNMPTMRQRVTTMASDMGKSLNKNVGQLIDGIKNKNTDASNKTYSVSKPSSSNRTNTVVTPSKKISSGSDQSNSISLGSKKQFNPSQVSERTLSLNKNLMKELEKKLSKNQEPVSSNSSTPPVVNRGESKKYIQNELSRIENQKLANRPLPALPEPLYADIGYVKPVTLPKEPIYVDMQSGDLIGYRQNKIYELNNRLKVLNRTLDGTSNPTGVKKTNEKINQVKSDLSQLKSLMDSTLPDQVKLVLQSKQKIKE